MADEIRSKKWMKQLGEYMQGELGINLWVGTISGEEIGGAVNRWEGGYMRHYIIVASSWWRREVQLYSNKMNSLGAIVLEQSSCSNIEQILWGSNGDRGLAGGAMDCPLCGAVDETVGYFVIECAVHACRTWMSGLGWPWRMRFKKYCCLERNRRKGG